MAQIDIGTAQLAFVERGAGDHVVLVHGSSSDHRTWGRQLESLGEQYHVLAYSRRYHWPNAPIEPGIDYSMLEHVDDLAAVIEEQRMAPTHVVGHSYGAFVALLLAMRRPGLVRSLVLIEPPVLTLFTSDPPKPMELFSLLVTRPRTALAIAHFGATGVEPANDALRRGDVDGALERHAIAVLGPDAFRNLSPARLAQARANFIEAELLGSGFPPVDPQEIRALKVPVLLVNGEKSPRMFHCFVDRLCELLPHARRIQIPDASHIVHEDAPEALTAAVRSFLSTPR